MEREKSDEGVRALRCGGCLKLKLPIKYIWRKSKSYIRRSKSCSNAAAIKVCVGEPKKPKFHGGFRYDPLSYAQNFDEGVIEYDNPDDYEHGFSSRYAALPASKHTVH